MALSTHTALRNHHHHHASPQLFHHPEQQLCTHYTIGSLPHSPQPLLLLLLLLSHFSRVRLCETPQTAAHQAPHPWDSPGKNTGVGYHFLLQCMKMKSESEVAQSCPTLSDHMDCSLPGSSVHGIFQAKVLEWVAIAFSVISVWNECNCALVWAFFGSAYL